MADRRSVSGKTAELLRALEAEYGRPENQFRFSPMDELVACILSQHTSDANSLPAFARLKAAFPLWEEMAAASEAQIAVPIQAAGLANQKAKSIRSTLQEVFRRTGGYSIDLLAEMPLDEARAWLGSLPGVGPKTAAIVLCFAFGKEIVPVDTHVFRVGWRYGLFPFSLGADRAHDVLLAAVPPGSAYAFHMLLIRLGREICQARKPLCAICPASSTCATAKASAKLKPLGVAPRTHP